MHLIHISQLLLLKLLLISLQVNMMSSEKILRQMLSTIATKNPEVCHKTEQKNLINRDLLSGKKLQWRSLRT